MTNHGLQKKPGFARSEICNIAKLSKKEEEEKKQKGVKYIVLVQEAKRIMGEYKCIWLTKKIKSICTCTKPHQVG